MIEFVAKRAVQARWADVEDLPSSPLQKVIMAILFIFTLTAFLTWVLRMYSKVTSKQIGLANIDLRQFFSIALLGPTYMFFKYYYAGFPTSSLPEDWDPSPMLFWNWIMQVLYNPILALVKSSVLVFLLRLGGHKPGVRYTIYALNAINLATMVAIFLVVLFQTIPINAFWDSTIPKQREIDGPLFYIVSAIITIVTDFFVLAIPFWIFLGLKMLNLSIIAACIPALRPLFRKWMPGMFSNKSSAGNAGYNSSQYAPYGAGTGNGTGPGRINRNTTGNGFPLKDMRNTHTEIRGHSPDGSEEEIMTFNGIIRTTNVRNKTKDGGLFEAANIVQVQVTYNDSNSFTTDKESGTEHVDAEKPVKRNSKFGLGSNV
ncbi:CFEM domain-containing protein [Colletotrichum tofieldiae]|nr:CFEM domain-containing protein [Colletotrichum tofieldiae]